MSGDPWAEYDQVALAERAGLSVDHLRLLAIGSLRTELNNGGFDQYFFNSAGDLVLIALAAAEEAGAVALAALIRQALDLLNVADPTNPTARQEALARLGPEDFQPLDEAYLTLEASADLDGLMRSLMA
jgi:hypothetical protein